MGTVNIKKRIAKYSVYVLLAIILIWFFILVLFILGYVTSVLSERQESGSLTKPCDIPYIGKYFEDLQTEERIRYYSKTIYHGGLVFRTIFTGITTEEAVMSFCNKKNDWMFVFPMHITENWEHFIQSLNIDVSELPLGTSENDIYAIRTLIEDDAYISIRFNFRRQDGRFTVFAVYSKRVK